LALGELTNSGGGESPSSSYNMNSLEGACRQSPLTLSRTKPRNLRGFRKWVVSQNQTIQICSVLASFDNFTTSSAVGVPNILAGLPEPAKNIEPIRIAYERDEGGLHWYFSFLVGITLESRK